MIQHPFVNPKMNLPQAQGPLEWILHQFIGSDGQAFALSRLHFNGNLRFEKTVTCGTRGNNQSRILNKSRAEVLRLFAGEFQRPESSFELSIPEQTVAGNPQSGGFGSLSLRL